MRANLSLEKFAEVQGDSRKIEEAGLTPAKEKKSSAGRKPIATAPN
jgi:hypothetical protein